MEIHIGCSGWHYKHWLGPFYPPKLPASQMLAFYQQRFDTVEINNTFYHLPTEEAVAEWREAAPAGFCYAVKGSRFLTHMKKLKDPEQGLERFFARSGLLGPKLGPVLWQLPPHWQLNLERLEGFLSALPRDHRYAFEFRNPTWNVPAVYSLLASYNAACCVFDLDGRLSPVEITGDFLYIRLHGPGARYQGSYSDAALDAWAERLTGWRKSLHAVYVYFDNDESAHAPHDALRLRARVE